jgi:hypothetical protein
MQEYQAVYCRGAKGVQKMNRELEDEHKNKKGRHIEGFSRSVPQD